MYKFVVVNMTGGKAEGEKLQHSGDDAGRALILANDSLHIYGKEVDALLCVGMSNYQMEHAVDSHMSARGYVKIVHPDYLNQKQAYRYTCVTVAYVKRDLNVEQICYDESGIETKYRYVAFKFDKLEVRTIHIPIADQMNKRYEEQLSRKEKMLNFEKELEEAAEKEHMKVITCGDFNCESGNLVCHEIFDALPFEKLLDEPTWEDKKIDNVLISSGMAGKVKAYTGDFRLGKTSDHKAVIIEVED